MQQNKPNAVCFDEQKAQQELKKCPKIVRDYVVLLKNGNDRMQDMVKQAVKKSQEELDIAHNFKVKLKNIEDSLSEFNIAVKSGEISVHFEDPNSNAKRTYHNLIGLI